MEILQWFTGLVISLGLLVATIHLVRTRRLREEHALLWMAACSVIFVLSVFPGLAGVLASVFAVTYTPTLLLVLGLVFALAILLSHSVQITSLADHERDLAQHLAILELEIRKLQEQLLVPTSHTTNNKLSDDAAPAALEQDHHGVAGVATKE